MKFNKFMIVVLMTFALQGCLTEPDLKMPFRNFTPENLNDGWEISTPSAEGIDSLGMLSVFQDFHNDEDVWQVRSLSVFRNGKLVAESYTKDNSDKYTPRAVWSATKQVMGILVGIAIENGLIGSIDDRIENYLPQKLNSYPDKKDITIRQLLTMQSGIDFDNYGLSGDDSQILQQIPDNLLDFILKKKLYAAPGEDYKYKDSDPQILAAILEKITGKSLDVWADEVLFSKIGFSNYEWKKYRDGSTLGSFGIMTTPRELAKIAQTVLNGGIFNANRVVNENWIAEMVKPDVEAGDKHFGYLWWSYPEHKTYFMSGNGRQLAFVFPQNNLIVVITSETNLQGKFNLNTAVGRKFGERIAAFCD